MKRFFQPTKGFRRNTPPPSKPNQPAQPAPPSQPRGGKGHSRSPAPAPQAPALVQGQSSAPPTNTAEVQGNPFFQPQQQRRREW